MDEYIKWLVDGTMSAPPGAPEWMKRIYDSVTWMWMTLRLPEFDHSEDAKPRHPLAFLVEDEHIHKIIGYHDILVLYNPELNVIARERNDLPAPSDAIGRALFVQHGDDKPWPFAETLDEFATKVGAPTRPRVDVPEAFRRESL